MMFKWFRIKIKWNDLVIELIMLTLQKKQYENKFIQIII